MDRCYEYNPFKNDEWVETAPLVYSTWAHIMTTAPDVDSISNQALPLVLGSTSDTLIRDLDSDEWRSYKEFPDEDEAWLWLSYGCLVRYRYKVYHIREEVFELDTLLWEVKNLGSVPEFVANDGVGPGRCAITEIDKKIGK